MRRSRLLYSVCAIAVLCFGFTLTARQLPLQPARDAGQGVFAIKVPKDFGDKRLTWTITANGQTNSIPVGVIKRYQIEPFKEAAQGNEPPRLQLDAKGPTLF